MIALAALGYLLSAATAALLIAALWPAALSRRDTRALVTCLALAMGPVAGSASDFLRLLLLRPVPAGGWLLDGALLIAAIAAWRYRNRHQREAQLPADGAPLTASLAHRTAWLEYPVMVGLGLALVCVVAALVLRARIQPDGLWDAWAMWNFKARFLYFAEPNWTVIFSAQEAGTHPDYPLLVPMTVARLWRWAGADVAWAPQVVAGGATLLTLLTLTAAVTVLRGLVLGGVAGLTLLGSNYFIKHGMSQYADVPLSLYMLAALAVLAIWHERDRREAGLLVLAGALAGSAAWTKNEGAAFAVWFILALAVVSLGQGPQQAFRAATAAALGVAAVAWMTATVKLGLTQTGTDLFSNLSGEVLWQRATDAERYTRIVRAGRAAWVSLTHPWSILGALALVALGGWRRPAGAWRALAVVGAILALQILTYAAVYLLTSAQLQWHLQTSVERLFAQVWPSIVLLLFLAARPLPAPQA
ncbi:MAG TPA: hypothetical protein VF184_04680 [Phycisphaeraceae bacterium]